MSTLDRFLHRVAFLGVFVFVVGYAIAIPLYPGGTNFDHTHTGYDLADNYLCDAFRPRAYDGRPNVVGARVAELAIVGFIFASSAVMFAVPRTFEARRPRLARVARGMALLGFFGMLWVLLTPSNEHDSRHFIVVGFAAIPGLGAMLLVSIGILGELDRRTPLDALVRWLTIMMVAGSAVHVVQYAAELAQLVGSSVWVPRLQKFVVIVMVAWIASVARWSVAEADAARGSASRIRASDRLAPKAEVDR